jgi:hypothetical protein
MYFQVCYFGALLALFDFTSFGCKFELGTSLEVMDNRLTYKFNLKFIQLLT